jgi:hypothetical protein
MSCFELTESAGWRCGRRAVRRDAFDRRSPHRLGRGSDRRGPAHLSSRWNRRLSFLDREVVPPLGTSRGAVVRGKRLGSSAEEIGALHRRAPTPRGSLYPNDGIIANSDPARQGRSSPPCDARGVGVSPVRTSGVAEPAKPLQFVLRPSPFAKDDHWTLGVSGAVLTDRSQEHSHELTMAAAADDEKVGPCRSVD